MNAGVDLDRRLATWFADEAPAHAPDRILADALEVVGWTPQQRAYRRTSWHALSGRRRALILAAAIALAVGAAVIAGALLLQTTSVPPPVRLLVARSVGGEAPAGSAVEIVAVDGEGSEEILATFGNDQLGGPWSGFQASYSGDGRIALPTEVGGPDSVTAIVDLRDPAATPRRPDSVGYQGIWGPEGRFAMDGNDGTIVVYDVGTGATTRVSVPPATALISTPFAYAWTADGAGFAAEGDTAFGDDSAPGGVRPAPLKTLLLDGTAVEGGRPVAETGVGPRRVREDGVRLRCRPEADDTCTLDDATLFAVGDAVTPVWNETRPDVRVADFAWAKDGGIWILLETVAAGPRNVTLIRVAPDGIERVVAAFTAGADDPDPNSYSQGGSFLAMAPDDAHLVVALSGDSGQSGPQVIVDTATGATRTVAGTVAGWFAHDDLTRTRPAVQPIAEVPAAARGEWVRILADETGSVPAGAHRVTLGRSSAAVRIGSAEPVALQVAADGPSGLRITQAEAGLGCEPGSTAAYEWTTAPRGSSLTSIDLSLTAVDDPCPGRRAILEGDLTQNLPYRGNLEAKVAPGSTYVAAEMGARLTIPTTGDTLVWTHGNGTIALGQGESDIWTMARPIADERGGYPAPVMAPGLDGALTYIDGVDGITFDERTETTVGGQPAVSGRLHLTNPDDRHDGLWQSSEGGFGLRDGSTLTVVEGPDSTIYVILANGAVPGAAPSPWARALTDSIEFVAPPG